MTVTTTIRFQEISTRRSVTGTCPRCGKRSTRSRRFVNFVSPFNCDADGTPKSPTTVQQDILAEADAWVPDFTHSKCAGGAR